MQLKISGVVFLEKISKKVKVSEFSVKSIFREWGLIFVILLIVVVATFQRPAFLSGGNLVNILRSYSTIGIAALGMAYAIIGGGMDLSISSTVSLSAVVTMLIVNGTVIDGISPVYATFLALLAGIVIGGLVGCLGGGIMAAVNGRMGESFIITYAIQIIIAAVANGVVAGKFQAAEYKGGFFKQIGMGLNPVLIFLFLAICLEIVLKKTIFGRNLYFLGANMQAAKMAGIRTRRTRFFSHVICGICAGIAGVIVVSRVNSASISQGLNYEMDAMACVAIGGTSLDGGSGSIAKTVLGVIMLGVLLNALNLLGIRANEQLIVRGAVVVIAVVLDTLNKKAKLKEVAK